MTLSAQNVILPQLGADLRPIQPEPALRTLSHLAICDLARLWHADPEAALKLAAEDCAEWRRAVGENR